MKKLFYLLCAAMMLLVLGGCSSDDDKDVYGMVLKENVEEWIIGKWLVVTHAYPNSITVSFEFFEYGELREVTKFGGVYRCGYRIYEMTHKEEKDFMEERKKNKIEELKENYRDHFSEEQIENSIQGIKKIFDDKIKQVDKQKYNSVYLEVTSHQERDNIYKIYMTNPEELTIHGVDYKGAYVLKRE